MTDYIKIEDLSFSYEKRRIYNNFSLTIPSNRITFIMGNNGCGKTTLLKLMCGIMKPQKGNIFFGEYNLGGLSVNGIAKKIAYVPQTVRLGSEMSVKDYLILGRTPYIAFGRSPSKNDYSIVEQYAQKMNVEDMFDISFNELSGGQKQLVAVTRALIQETPYIIMDEPMSALDFSNQSMILKVVSSLARDNKTIVLTSHNPNHALAVESEVCLIDKNKNIIQGTANEILSNQENITNTFGERVAYQNSASGGSISFSI